MITGISIENFKGIRDRVDIEFRPLTLLFGANSAGKSTIVHALHYAREIFQRRNLDPDQTVAGGQFANLGGYATFIHGHDLGRRTRLTIEINVSDKDFPDFKDPHPEWLTVLRLDPMLSEFQKASVSVEVGWSQLANGPFVSEYSVSIQDRWVATITQQPGRPEVHLKFDSTHPVFASSDENVDITLGKWEIGKPRLGTSTIEYYWQEAMHLGGLRYSSADEIPLPLQGDALVDVDRRIRLPVDRSEVRDPETSEGVGSVTAWIEYALSHVICGPGQIIRDCLVSSRYLGPLRSSIPASFEAPRFPDESRWSTGLGAWDVLLNGPDKLVQDVSSWLGDSDKLDSGFRIVRKRYKEVDLSNPLLVQLMTGRAFDDAESGAAIDFNKLPTKSRIVVVPVNGGEFHPGEVGIGISQVVPVIVSALDGCDRLVAIEQPELHIHPRLQAELADMFLEATQTQQNRFLIETHSEHCILRLQRRIRETTLGNPVDGRALMSEDVVVYHVSSEDGCTKVRRIDVDKNGDFVQPWPDDFFEIDFYERFGHDR